MCLVEAGWRPSFIHVYHSTSCTVYNPGDYALFRHVYNMVCCGNARQFLKLEQFPFFGRFVIFTFYVGDKTIYVYASTQKRRLRTF